MPAVLVGERYQITSRVGKGGMATVYLAWDTRLRLWCALKVIGRRADPVLRSRFAQEARVMARLSHPHLVRLFDLVEEVETPYMAMEFMEGGTVARRLAAGALDARTAARLAADVCSALEAAHAAGVVHRDIKPQNLMLDRTGLVKVGDFGIARTFADTRLTVSNVALGTLAYMPPEQLRDAASVDERADLYGVGATLYALCTGRRPNGLCTSDRDRALEVVPEALREVVRRATELDREARFGSATELEQALRAEIPACAPTLADAPPLVVQPRLVPSRPPAVEEMDLDPAEFVGTGRRWRSDAPEAEAAKPSAAPTVLLRDEEPEPDVAAQGARATAGAPVEPPPPYGRWAAGLTVLGGAVLCAGLCSGALAGGLGGLLF